MRSAGWTIAALMALGAFHLPAHGQVPPETWEVLEDVPVLVAQGGGITVAGGEVYAMTGSSVGTPGFFRFAGGAWNSDSIYPLMSFGGGLVTAGTYIFGVGDDYMANSTRPMRYTISPGGMGSWETRTPVPGNLYLYGAMVNDGAGYIHLIGYFSGSMRFFRFHIGTDVWESRALPPGQSSQGSLAVSGSTIYYLPAESSASFYSYSTGPDQWNIGGPLDPADAPMPAGAGTSLTATAGDGLFALLGGNSFWNFSIVSGTWSPKADAPGVIGSGAALCVGPGYLYALQGGNTPGFWRYRLTNHAPDAPAALAQLDSQGATVPQAGEIVMPQITLRATLTDVDGGPLQIQAELQIVGSGWPGTSLTSGPVASGQAASVQFGSMVPGTEYHWRVRTVDDLGLVSGWSYHGTPDINEPDFEVRTNAAPTVSGLQQYRPVNGQIIPPGGSLFDSEGVRFAATPHDDDGDMVSVEVETAEGSEDFMAHPKDAVETIARMCSHDPKARHQSMAEVCEDLELIGD